MTLVARWFLIMKPRKVTGFSCNHVSRGHQINSKEEATMSKTLVAVYYIMVAAVLGHLEGPSYLYRRAG